MLKTTCLFAAALLLSLPAFAARPRPTQCNQPSHQAAVRTAIEEAVACRDALLDGSATSCNPAAPPLCSKTLVQNAVELAYGAVPDPVVPFDPAALQTQFTCQQAIGAGAAAYTWQHLQHRIDGLTESQAHDLASAALDPIAGACSLNVAQDGSGVVLPAPGFQCGAAAAAPGSAVDGAALADCLGTLLGVWVERIGPDPQPLRPNFVVIYTDDQRWDTLDATHSPDSTPVMPNTLARIADSGVTFNEAFVSSPKCAPSRASLLTGQYASTHGAIDQFGPLRAAELFQDDSTLARWLDAANYRTGLVGKYLNGYQALFDFAGLPPYVPPGWDKWYALKSPGYFDYALIENGVEVDYGSAEEDYSTDVLRDKAVGFLEVAISKGDPFFLYFAPLGPHTPEVPAPRHDGSFAGVAPHRPPNHNEIDVSDKAKLVSNKPFLTTTDVAQIDTRRQSMLEQLQSVDEAVAAIVDTLEQGGVLDDTVIVFMSDNGYAWGEHRLRKKSDPYRHTLRTPFLLRYPKLAPLPRTESRMAINIDIAPTLAELAGALPTLAVDGESLVRVIDGTATSWRTDFLGEAFWDNYHRWGMVREADWKYVEWPYGAQELYDLAADPFELQSLHADPAQAGRLSDMADRLREYRPEWPDDASP